MTNTKRGPGRPPKAADPVVDATADDGRKFSSPADAPKKDAPAVMRAPDMQPAPAPAAVADIQAMMAEERAKIMAQARMEIEAAQAKAREEAKEEAAKLVEAAMKAEAEERAKEDERLRLARAAQDLVEVRILPIGHCEIFTGFLDEITNRPVTYRKGEKPWFLREIAEAHEKAGRVEILS